MLFPFQGNRPGNITMSHNKGIIFTVLAQSLEKGVFPAARSPHNIKLTSLFSFLSPTGKQKDFIKGDKFFAGIF